MRNSVFAILLSCVFSACASNSETSGDSSSTPANQKQDSTIKDASSKNILTGKFNPAETKGFVKVTDEMALVVYASFFGILKGLFKSSFLF